MTYHWIILIVYAVYLVVMSLVTLVLFKKDKVIATGNSKERIKEKTLLEGVVMGGAIGGFVGRILFHHKTNKIYFSITIYLSLLLQVVIAAVLVILAVL